MPIITFTADPKLPRDLAHLAYKKGQTHDLAPDQCERWVCRGFAVYGAPEAPKAPEPPAAAAEPSAVAAGIPDEGGTLPAFNPATAHIDAVREFLAAHNVRPGRNTSEAKMRETALEILARG